MATVYRKTAKGQAEIDTRAHRLVPRLRTALILVDGKRGDAELAKLIFAEPQQTLQTLLDDGFIEVAGTVVDVPARPAAPPPAAPAKPAPNPKAFEQHRRAAVRSLNELVGPVGEAVAMKIEGARTWEQLLPALQLAQRVIANTRGGAAAEEFGKGFIDAPPS
jgi:hypothetical protein